MIDKFDGMTMLHGIRRRTLMQGAAAGAIAAGILPGMAYGQDSATEITPATPLADVPRDETLILGWSMTSPIGVTNPWAVPGYTHQEGNNLMWEPLMYFGIFKDDYIPWLAESMEYTAEDFTSLQIKVNPMAKWSDGTPVTARDVVFTFEGQYNNNKLPYHAAFQQFMESATAVDDLTVDVKFKIPAPRFKFEVLCLKFDTGIPIVPAHALEGAEDVNAVSGGVEMPHSGPYDLVAWNANQKIFNLRESWWAAEAGVAEMPQVKRVVIAQLGGQVGQNMDTVAQRLVNNEMDSALDMRSSVIGNILAQNDKITTHAGNQSPYGYLDWWPNSLWMNTAIAPFDDARVRRAISLSINRQLINDILYEGAEIATIYPFPLYPGLQAFVDSPEVKAVEEALQPGLYDPEQAAALMAEAGYTKNGSDLWEKDGQTVNCTIHGFEGIHSDIVPILVEFLLASGFDATVNFGTDAYQSMSDGAPGLYMFGHGASLQDPYAAFELFHGRFSEAIGTSAGNNRFSRYSNPEYDQVVDAMAPLSSDDPVFFENAVKAMEIYWREQIDVPIIQWLHRIAYNQTYWTNWPTTENVAGGSNGAFWAHTGLLVVTGLKKA
jgi:peptide/nickel transport system substrate-binding protein